MKAPRHIGNEIAPEQLLDLLIAGDGRRLLRKVRPGDVVLFHDGVRGGDPVDRTPTVRALEIVLQELAQRGWRMVTVEELFSARLIPRGDARTNRG